MPMKYGAKRPSGRPCSTKATSGAAGTEPSGPSPWLGSFYFGAPANGAWGTYAVSWELYDAYENGDKRRDGSLVTATIPESKLKEIGKEHWKQSFKPEAWLQARTMPNI